MGCAPLDFDWIKQHMRELVDVSDVALATAREGELVLYWYEEVASEFDLEPPVIEEPQPWEWDTDPPLGVMIRELAEKLHPGAGVTQWLYTQQELAWYTAQQEAMEDGQGADLPTS